MLAPLPRRPLALCIERLHFLQRLVALPLLLQAPAAPEGLRETLYLVIVDTGGGIAFGLRAGAALDASLLVNLEKELFRSESLPLSSSLGPRATTLPA